MRTDNAADIRLNAMLENCIFYIFRMYEFSHSLGRVEERRGSLGHSATLRFLSPLIEPDRQISRIRLSDKTSRLCFACNAFCSF